MRTLIVSFAAAASALALATPAAAQYYPPQGNAYGYNNNYGSFRSLQVRIDNVQRQISHFDRRNIINDREANRLKDQARDLERRLRAVARHGLNPYEARDIQLRLVRLEQRLHRDANDGRRWTDNRGGWTDHDRDGRDDRYEDDRGRDRDGRRDRDDD